MGYVHIGVMKGILVLNPTAATTLLDRIGKAFIAEQDVVSKAREFYRRLDKRFHLNSDNWVIRYLPERDGDTLGCCRVNADTGETIGIDIYPDALVSYEVFFDVLRHEYSHALADWRWEGDPYYESHSEHGRRWQEVAKEVGCKARGINAIPGRYFSCVIVDSNGVKRYFATSDKDAEEKLAELQKASEGKDISFSVVDGEVIYQDYLDRLAAKTEAAKAKRLAEIQHEREERRKAAEARNAEIRKREAELTMIANAVSNIERLINSEQNPVAISHKYFGNGLIQKASGGRLYVSFDSGKNCVLSIRKITEQDLVSYPGNPYIDESAQFARFTVFKSIGPLSA